MTQLELAESIARKVLKGKTRRVRGGGVVPAITHTERIVKAVYIFDAKVVAWLHDVMEDCDMTTEDLLDEGVEYGYVSTLSYLTHDRGVLYNEYIRDVMCDDLAVTVKIADIVDNLTDDPTERQITKYKDALTILVLERR
jgi:hypothetical protein